MSVFEMAKKYDPRLWSRERVGALAAAGKLTEEEKAQVLGEDSHDGV